MAIGGAASQDDDGAESARVADGGAAASQSTGDLYFDEMTHLGEFASFENVASEVKGDGAEVYPRGVFKFRSVEESSGTTAVLGSQITPT